MVSVRKPHTFAGSVDANGDCEGQLYYDEFGSWRDVVVEGFIQVSLSKDEVIANLGKDIIHLPNQLRCSASDEHCIDAVQGEYYWKLINEGTCKEQNHVVLYEGLANITKDVKTKQNIAG